jgi:SNF2 family DNA or RNA helicase
MEDVATGADPSFLRSKNLLPFQIEDIAVAYMADGHALVWDCGTGKSVAGMALSVLCFQDEVIDHVLLVCERNKIREWVDDFAADTDLSVLKHHGAGRQKRLERLGVPQVLVTTYETAKRDLAASQGPRSFSSGWLLRHYLGKRVLVIYDESSKLRNRSSGNYKAQQYVLKRLRKEGSAKVLQLTATPLEKDYEDGFNQLRLAVPDHMPLVKDFEETYIRYRDIFGRPVYDQALIGEFMERVHPHISRRRKTDPEVIEQFPPLTEEYRFIELSQPQKDFYRMAETLAFEMSERSEKGPDFGVWSLLRQIAGHPASIVHSARKEGGSKFAKEIVDVLGERHLQGLPSSKTEELKSYLDLVVNAQGAKAVVFTFFGQSVLTELEVALREAGYAVFPYHGGQSSHENEVSKTMFREHAGGAIFLASDAGARGINLPEATYVIEYESALTHAMRIQRRDRVHRITSAAGPVTSMTFIAEGTIEEDIFRSVLKRNEKHDIYAGDLEAEEEFISAADRRVILAMARERYEKRRK